MTSSMRVCLVLETYWPQVGGGESAGRLLARGLAERGHDVQVFTRHSVAGVPLTEREGGITIHRLPPAGRGAGKKWWLVPPMLAALASVAVTFDVVVVLGFRVLGVPAVLAGRWYDRPVILKAESRGEASGAFFDAGLQRLGLSRESRLARTGLRLRDRVLAGASGWVAMSTDLADEFLASGVPAGRIHRIPNPIDTEVFRPPSSSERSEIRRRLDLDPVAPTVLYAGRFVEYKGILDIAEAWPAVLARRPDARLVFLGEGGTDIAACAGELHRRVEELGLKDSVRIEPPVSDVAPWLMAADVFALPTRDEAFGLAAAEAMACGLAVVATSVGGLADFVRDGDNALTVAPSDPVGLATAILEAIDSDRFRPGLRAQARATIVRQFDTGRVLDAWETLFQHAVRA